MGDAEHDHGSMRLAAGRTGAVVLAAGGVVLAIAAETKPWASITLPPDPRVVPPTPTLDLTQLIDADAMGYHLVLCALLGLLGLAVFSGTTMRRGTATAVLGVCAGQAVLLSSIVQVIHTKRPSGQFFDQATGRTVPYELADGFYLAAAALALIALAAVVVMVVPGGTNVEAQRGRAVRGDATGPEWQTTLPLVQMRPAE